MWFRRLFRRRRPPPPVLLPSLDRLAELIERVVELLDEVALGPRSRADAQHAAPAPNPPALASPVPNPGPAVRGHVLLVVLAGWLSAAGAGGTATRPGRLLELDDEDSACSGSGPRRCRATGAAARISRGRNHRRWIEPSSGEGREPDPRHARRAAGRPRAGRAGPAAIGRERPCALRDTSAGARAGARTAPVFPESSARPVALR